MKLTAAFATRLRVRIAFIAACAPLAALAQAPEQRERLVVEAIYTGEMWRQISSGAGMGARYLDDLQLSFDVDLDPTGRRARTFFASALYNNGHSINELSVTAQGVSNIEATDAVRVYELWFEQTLGSQDASLLFGLYDLNSEFDSIEAASLFLNPSHGIGAEFAATGENGPSIFPTTSLALRFAAQAGALAFRSAVLDGVPGDPEHPNRTRVSLSSDDGALFVNELDYREGPLRLGAGYWMYTSDFEELVGAEDAARADNNGFYVYAEAVLAGERGLRPFFRYGRAEPRVNPIAQYLGAGVVYGGLLPERFDAQLGFAIARAGLGGPGQQALASQGLAPRTHETIYEATLRLQASEWLALQADVQYVDQPAMSGAVPPGWAVGLRFEVAQRWSR